MKKRILAILLTVAMCLSLLPTAAFAADVPRAVNGQYDAAGTWSQTEYGGSITYEDAGITLKKSATPDETDPNKYTIKLEVVTSQTTTITNPSAAATVLVIDVSGSMAACAECEGEADFWGEYYHDTTSGNCEKGKAVQNDQTRLKAAQNAALSFLDSYAGESAGVGRYLSIVKFSTDGSVVLDWIDVSGKDSNGYNSAKSAINGLSTGGGTNLDDGLYDANGQMDKHAISSVPAANRNVIALTDGVPTYARDDSWDGRMGDGSNGSKKINSATAATAATLKGNASVYTVCFGVANDHCYNDGPTVGTFLEGSIATAAKTNEDGTTTKYAYNADNTAELNTAFAAITNSITSGITGEGLTVTDPMGSNVALDKNTVSSDVISGDNITWELGTPKTTTAGNVTYYTYTLTYDITVNSDAEGFKEGTYYPANAPTYLTIPGGEGEQDQLLAFPVPGVTGVSSRFTVIYDNGEHGALADQDNNGQVVHSNVKIHTATPAAPAVTPEDGHYFTGWDADIAATVTGNVTYTAQYAPKKEITIAANSGEYTYDRSKKTASGYTVSGLPEGYELSGVSASVSGTHAGTYTNEVSGTAVIKDASGNDVTNRFIVNKVPGELKINKRNVTLTSATDSKEYDGKYLTNDKITVSGDGFADGEGATYDVTGQQKVVGTSPNAFSYALKDNTKAENYIITQNVGHLTVTNRTAKYQITVDANSANRTYNGNQQTVEGFKTLEFTVNGEEFTVSGLTAFGSGTDVNAYTVTVDGTAVVKDADGNDVTSQFAVTANSGTLTINKRDVTLTSASAEKEYNGTPLTRNEVTVSGAGFVTGEGATYDVTGSRTLVGSSENTFTYSLNEGTKADNYNITVVPGTLTVTNRDAKYEITVEANSGEFKYDGSEKAVSGFKTQTFTVEGNTYTVEGLTASVTGTNAGTYPVNVTGAAVVKDAAGNDVTSQFAVNTKAGSLVITKRDVTLTSATDSKQYDGKALTNGNVTVGGDGFATGEGATYNVTGSQTLRGNSTNAFTYTLNEGTKGDNYNITKAEGTLTVTDREKKFEITVEANSGEYLYDGTAKTAKDFKTLEFDFNGVKFTVSGLTASAEGIDAGEYPVAVSGTAVVTDAQGNDVTDQFIVKTQDGQLKINKRNVTLTSATDSKQYDGKALTNKNVAVSGDGFAEGEGAAYNVTGSQKVAGSSSNEFSYALNRNTKADNYNITTVPGTLIVTDRDAKYEITVVAKSGTEKYDGTEKSVSGIETNTFEVEGNTYTVSGLTASAEGTDAGTYSSEVKGTAKVMDADNNDVTSQFTVKTVNGSLEITKRTVTLTSATDSKQYDGTALTNNTVTVSGDGFATGEGATYDVTGSQTLVGSSENFFSYKLNDNTKVGNYEISTNNGTLTVVTRDAKYQITVKANSGEFKYDGEAKTVSGFETLKFTIENGLTYTVSGLNASTTETNAGEYTVNVTGTPVVKDAAGNDVSSEFAVSTTDGKLTITKRNVTLTSATDSKTYDGTALTNDTITVGGDGFATGEGATYNVTGSQTLAGYSSNAFTYALNEGTKAENYNITTEEGTLTVNRIADQIVITADSASKVYDGTPLTKDTYTYTDGILKDGDVLTAVVEGTITEAGTVANKVVSYKVMRGDIDVTNSYTFGASVDGTLEVTKKPLTITADSASKKYDGTALTKNSYNNTDLADGDKIESVTVTGSQTQVGTSSNVPSAAKIVNAAGEDVTASYDITYVDGKLTVQKKSKPPVDTDVPDNPPALNTEDHFAYIVGYPDGNVKPAGNITRAEVATIFFRLLTDEARDLFWSTENEYTDVNADQWFNNAISTLSNAGIINGYPDGTFRPNATITRAEFAKIAASFFESIEYTVENPFVDVSQDDWFFEYVMTAYETGLITGYPEGDFRPNAFITRAEACTIVNRTIDRNPHEDQLHEDMIPWPDNPAPSQGGHAWYYEQIQEATNSHNYEMKNEYENWTEILPNRDWVALEQAWADSNDAPGGSVMK